MTSLYSCRYRYNSTACVAYDHVLCVAASAAAWYRPPDPRGFVAQLVGALVHLDTIKHPGRVGQVPGTREWVLTRLPYLAVFQKLPIAARINPPKPETALKKTPDPSTLN